MISVAAQTATGSQGTQAVVQALRSEQTFWQLYRWWIVGVALLCVIQTSLILGFLMNCARRRRKERFRQELASFSRAATVNEAMASLAHELNQPLAAILCNAEAARRLMKQGSPDMKELREILNDIVADNQRAADVIRGTRSALKRRVTNSSPFARDLIMKTYRSCGRFCRTFPST
jgi:C4-dicarboxylate-specific signal transduction histidine kinase